MTGDDTSEHEPYLLVEERSSDIGPFLLGAALGAAIALLLAPRSGVETRAVLRRRARSAQQAAGHVAERVSGSFADAREEIERRIDTAKASLATRRRQFSDAVEAGRSAARQAERELRAELDRTGAGRRSSSGPTGGRAAKQAAPLGPRRPPRNGR